MASCGLVCVRTKRARAKRARAWPDGGVWARSAPLSDAPLCDALRSPPRKTCHAPRTAKVWCVGRRDTAPLRLPAAVLAAVARVVVAAESALVVVDVTAVIAAVVVAAVGVVAGDVAAVVVAAATAVVGVVVGVLVVAVVAVVLARAVGVLVDIAGVTAVVVAVVLARAVGVLVDIAGVIAVVVAVVLARALTAAAAGGVL